MPNLNWIQILIQLVQVILQNLIHVAPAIDGGEVTAIDADAHAAEVKKAQDLLAFLKSL